jgi:hypothetical protein
MQLMPAATQATCPPATGPCGSFQKSATFSNNVPQTTTAEPKISKKWQIIAKSG